MGKHIPPDGGYGWVVAGCTAICNISCISILQIFGLLFKETFKTLGISAMDASIIINTNNSFGMVLGLVNGPFLHKFGYRKGAITGSLLFCTGVIMTAFARNFTCFIIAYGMLTSIGVGMAMSAFSLALNTYFSKKRGRASGVTMTITGLGPILSPLIASTLLSHYGVQGTVLLFGGFSFNMIAAAFMLHPLKWHAKVAESEVDDEDNCEKKPLETENNGNNDTKETRKRRITISSIDYGIESTSVYGFETGSIGNIANSVSSLYLAKNQPELEEPATPLSQRYKRSDESKNSFANECQTINNNRSKDLESATEKNKDNLMDSCKETKKSSLLSRIIKIIVNLYDLTLFRDPIYVNIMFGLSLAVFAELNFSMFTPFILLEKGLTTTEVAKTMTTLAMADLLCRALGTFIAECCHRTARTMYLTSLMLLILPRTMLIFTTNFYHILVVAVLLGVGKGVRTVYMPLVMPSHVPIERLANATSIQSVVNGVIFMAIGPLLGLVRDVTGNYSACIVLINCITFSTIIMWITEFAILRVRRKQYHKTLSSN